ncbi:hypothetical protein BaRGS_00015975 [Batillaria attramentaria]|uniref:THAP-type domain-containing protein n=1 Tax=Batillaria attramentaria TaxID=370345 RepID=A0ABD0L1B0_9CAEN
MVKHCQWSTCTADERYPNSIKGKLLNFPNPKTRRAEALAWIKACGRPHADLNVTILESKSKRKHRAVCSGHFVNGVPMGQLSDSTSVDGSSVHNSDSDTATPLMLIRREQNSVQPVACLRAPLLQTDEQCLTEVKQEPSGSEIQEETVKSEQQSGFYVCTGSCALHCVTVADEVVRLNCEIANQKTQIEQLQHELKTLRTLETKVKQERDSGTYIT